MRGSCRHPQRLGNLPADPVRHVDRDRIARLHLLLALVSVDDEDADAANLQARLAADPHWNPAVAAALMVFVLLYAPCFMVVIMIRQETASTAWAVFSVVFNTIFAFTISTGVYQIGKLLL